MSTITNAYLRFIEVVRETFPANERYELTNPYIIEDNAEPIVAKGWGVAALSNTNLQRVNSCIYTLGRDVEVVLTNLVVGTDRGMAKRQAMEAKLMEDQIRLIASINGDGDLNDFLAKNDFVGDNGIEFVFTEKHNYISLISTWNIEYHQKIT